MLLVVFIVLINYNEFCYEQPIITINIRDINVNIYKGGLGRQGGEGDDQQSGSGRIMGEEDYQYDIDDHISSAAKCYSKCQAAGKHVPSQCEEICYSHWFPQGWILKFYGLSLYSMYDEVRQDEDLVLIFAGRADHQNVVAAQRGVVKSPPTPQCPRPRASLRYPPSPQVGPQLFLMSQYFPSSSSPYPTTVTE